MKPLCDVRTRPRTLLCSFPVDEPLRKALALTGNRKYLLSHLGANHKRRLLHRLFSGPESEMFRVRPRAGMAENLRVRSLFQAWQLMGSSRKLWYAMANQVPETDQEVA